MIRVVIEHCIGLVWCVFIRPGGTKNSASKKQDTAKKHGDSLDDSKVHRISSTRGIARERRAMEDLGGGSTPQLIFVPSSPGHAVLLLLSSVMTLAID